MLAVLKPNPKQKLYFGPLTQEERRALATDIEQNGLREPLQILPDGTIISGHERRLVLLDLRWRTVKVVVRHDLAAAGVDAIERRLIEANFSRRQLIPRR